MSDDPPENPIERLTEELHEEAVHGHDTWLKWSALLSALFAVLAAVSGLKSTQYASLAMVEQLQASDQWSYYQAKGIKATILESERDLAARLGHPLPPDASAGTTAARERAEQDTLKAKATAATDASRSHLERHEILSRAVTLFQVSIAVIAVSVLTRRRHFLGFAAFLALAGGWFLVEGLM